MSLINETTPITCVDGCMARLHAQFFRNATQPRAHRIPKHDHQISSRNKHSALFDSVLARSSPHRRMSGTQFLHNRLATSLNTSTTLRHLLQALDLHPVCGPVRASTVVQLCNCIGLHTTPSQMLRTAVTWFQSMSRQQNEFICSRDFAYVVKQGPFGAPPGHRLLPCQTGTIRER